jgi:glycosyltransferase involved in cell wall biosynthesis
MSINQSLGFSPKISAVMAVHNGQTFLHKALGSLAAQSFAGHELIAVDDGSADETAEILRAQADPRLRFISLPRNVGFAEALSWGSTDPLRKLGPRMNAADVASTGRLMAQNERMCNEPNLPLLVTTFGYIDAKERRLRWHPVQNDGAGVRRNLVDSCNCFAFQS